MRAALDANQWTHAARLWSAWTALHTQAGFPGAPFGREGTADGAGSAASRDAFHTVRRRVGSRSRFDLGSGRRGRALGELMGRLFRACPLQESDHAAQVL